MILFVPRSRRMASYLVAAAAATSMYTMPYLCSAQPAPIEREIRIMRSPGNVIIRRGTPENRAVLGVMLGEGSRADTAGVTLESVAENGPAAKAGLKAGDVITSINGVSLKVAREDAEDLALAGLAQRRLQRVMGKVNAGDDVALQVTSGGRSRAVTVKTVSPQSLEAGEPRVVERVITRSPDGTVTERRIGAPRAMIGVTVGAAGNLRDTLGLFVSSVVGGGPAEKAGLIEGERIATVNGIDVRVPGEDADDQQVVSARVDRFVREVQKVEAGKTIRLRVYGNGRYRDVTVIAGVR
ncbi:PDZ domain-containing protein [Gemmatimonas sp.]|uniref:PDZ domain-containing protein n=1 Tax=Gemmatimonas sp. TaxID=1962908 RepID=UPI003DA23131